MKKQMRLYLSLILSVSFVLVGLSCYKKVKASTDASSDNVYTYAEYNTTYKTTKTIPTDNVGTDTIFAGWYLDSDFTEPVKSSTTLDSEAEGNVYAKFVDKELLTLRLQLDADLASNLTAEYTSYMRLLTAVDSLNYQKVEFVVNGTPYTIKEVYSTVQGYKDGSNNSYTPQQTFGSEDAYRFAVMTLNEMQNLPATDATDHLGASLTVTPRWTTLDGTLVTGEEKTFEINDFFYEAEINDTLTGATDGSTHRWGSVNELEDYVSETDGVGGTGDAEAIVITVLKDASISQLNVQKNIQLVNAPGKTVTLRRGTETTEENVLAVATGCNQTFTLGSKGVTGNIIVDGTYTPDTTSAVAKRIARVYAGGTFILEENAILENANSTAEGAAIRNDGTVHLYGTIRNNKTSNVGGALANRGTATVYATAKLTDNEAKVGGAICQHRVSGGTNRLTIEGGLYSDNIATTYGGAIAANEETSKGTYPGQVKINDGTFESNEAVYGGAVSVYTRTGDTTNFIVTGGTFQNNTATAGGAFFVDSSNISDGTIYRTVLDISGTTTIQNNTASAESLEAVAGGGAIFMLGHTRVILNGVTISGNTAEGKAGCEIAINAVDSQNSDLQLKNYESFDGVVGYYGATNIDEAAYVQTGGKVLYLAYGKSYTVDCASKALTEITVE